jgi:hypothetical protein
MMEGEVEEREETSMRARLLSRWGRAATGAPSHGPARLPGHHHIELPGHGRVGLRGSWGAMTVSPSRIYGHLDKVLAVFTDQIQPPTKLQKRINWQT